MVVHLEFNGHPRLRLREPQPCAEPFRAQLCVIAAHCLKKVTALPVAQLELEPLPLGVLQHVAKLGLGHWGEFLHDFESALRRERAASITPVVVHLVAS
eukprot:CAMPEP_0184385294 /NCGR_PEP_ID=MMETSP0007-20130409/8706_1 /TAXON_ID=97485 /ORGANISM="Prymnesium parvum, Strain Texoma1" /LENGTH=98 /DNA_ID=CAMNT_0026732581 /DNA_START=349 /DNA_END=645 /DNA_ORIENTATION=-